jgi:nitrite reductase/ring-hydroxylating ferredoxin subunit
MTSVWIRIGDRDAIAPGHSRALQIGRFDVAIFNVDGEYYALENSCPHQGSPIVDGHVEKYTVTCPWHAWCFDLRTGSLTMGNFATIPRFAVRVEQDGVYLCTEPLPE